MAAATGTGETFGALLRRYRQAATLSQEELAERAGLSVDAVSTLERGRRSTPRPDTVALLVKALGLSPEERAAFIAAGRRQLSLPQSEPASASPTARMTAQGGFLGAVPSGPLVGREPELRRLLAAIDTAAGGQGHLLLLAGEPGVGKTRLAQELMLRASEREFRVVTGRCYEHYATVPFFPFVDVLAGGMALASPTLRQAAPHRFPYLGHLLPDQVESPPAREGEDFSLRILRAAGGFLTALAAEAPVALLLDDLHWADSSSLELLLHLARQMRGERIILAGTYRDVEVNRRHPLEATLAELVRDRLVEEIDLRGLSPAGTADLIGTHLGLEEVSPELNALIHARTEGNPFFTEEVLKALEEQGAIFRSGVSWDRKAIDQIEVPRSVRAVIGQRVGWLPASAQEFLQVASVLGQEWDLAVLIEAAGQDEEVALAALDAALAARLVEERRVGRRERYAFVHALIEQTLYEEVPRHRLRRLHLRAGEALERLNKNRSEGAAGVARHFMAAGEEQRALPYTILAGDHAAGLFAHAEAIRHYRDALELLEETSDALGAARVREKLGVELRVLGRYDEALALLDLAIRVYRAADDLEGMGRAMAQLGRVHSLSGTPREGIDRLLPVLASLEAHTPSYALASLCVSLAELFHFVGRYGDELAVATRAAEIARKLGHERLLAFAEYEQGMGLAYSGHVEEGLCVLEAGRARAEAEGDLDTLCAVLDPLGFITYLRGDLGASRTYYERAIIVAEQLGDPGWIANMVTRRGTFPFFTGRWDEAQVDFEQGVALSRRVQSSMFLTYALAHRGQLHFHTGEWAAATKDLEELISLLERAEDLNVLRPAQMFMAERDLLEGHHEAALARLMPLLDRGDQEEMDVTRLLPTLAWVHLALGDVRSAAEVAGQAVRRAHAQGLRLILVDALRVQAMVAVRQEQWTEAEQALEEGITLARAMPYPYAEARHLHVYGEMHAQKGEMEPARQRLAEALAIFHRLGAAKDSERVRDLLTTPG